MKLEIDIKNYLKSAFENGFKIAESKDYGMAKFCRLEYPILNLVVYYDRFAYVAEIEYHDKKYNIVHLANFLNDGKHKYKFFNCGFETRNIDTERFLPQLDEIIKSDFDNILHFFFNLTNEQQTEFDKYCEEANLDL